MKLPLDFFQEAFRVAPVGMLVVDSGGTIVELNGQLETLFGYPRGELVGQPLELLVGAGLAGEHRAHRAGYLAHPEPRPMGAGRDLFGRHRDGRQVPVEIGLTPLTNDGATWVLASVVDLTERRRTREQLEASLTETEILLRELHHRSKNNLQLISSLLDLASRSPGPDVLSECRDRITSIALLHEQLYQSGTLAHIKLSEYLRTLGEQISLAWTRTAKVDLRVEAEDISLPLDKAIPCGLVINELLTNAFKHAFPGARGGVIVVRATQAAGRVQLSVEDDGVGLPVGVPRAGLGLDLVRALARQLGGDLRFEGTRGTQVTLSFEGARA